MARKEATNLGSWAWGSEEMEVGGHGYNQNMLFTCMKFLKD